MIRGLRGCIYMDVPMLLVEPGDLERGFNLGDGVFCG